MTEEDVVTYEVVDQVARITLNRPEYRNAQNSAMTYALDAAFQRATDDDDGQGHRAGRQRQALLRRPRHRHAGPRRRPDVRAQGRDLVGPHRQGGRRPALRPRVGGLPRHVPALARDPQADHRDGAGRLHRRRADARLGVRLHHRLRRRVLLRPGRTHGHPGRRVLRAPVGDEPARRQGVPLLRRPVHRRPRARARHGQPGRTGRASSRARCWRWPAGSRRCRASASR